MIDCFTVVWYFGNLQEIALNSFGFVYLGKRTDDFKGKAQRTY